MWKVLLTLSFERWPSMSFTMSVLCITSLDSNANVFESNSRSGGAEWWEMDGSTSTISTTGGGGGLLHVSTILPGRIMQKMRTFAKRLRSETLAWALLQGWSKKEHQLF